MIRIGECRSIHMGAARGRGMISMAWEQRVRRFELHGLPRKRRSCDRMSAVRWVPYKPEVHAVPTFSFLDAGILLFR